MKKYNSKWVSIGIDNKQLKNIYERNRIKAYTILKDKHKKEYSQILNKLMIKIYLKRSLIK